MLTNGPLLEFSVDGQSPGDLTVWDEGPREIQGSARAAYFRPIESIEIVKGPSAATLYGSSWLAARVTAQTLEGEPVVQAHTNPIYFHRDGEPVLVGPARQAIRERWRQEVAYYRSGALEFPDERRLRDFLAGVEETSRALEH